MFKNDANLRKFAARFAVLPGLVISSISMSGKKEKPKAITTGETRREEETDQAKSGVPTACQRFAKAKLSRNEGYAQ
jgi:hypothetical protein